MKTYLNLPLLTEKQLEVVNGSLLGDASLHFNKKQLQQNCSFVKLQSKFDGRNVDKLSYMQWHFDVLGLYSSSINQHSYKTNQLNFTLKKEYYHRYVYRTHAHPTWTELAKKWYKRDENGNFLLNKINRIIKIVPRDLKLTPLTVCIWFMDDGFNYPKDGNAFLETQGFSVEDVEFLIIKLKEDLNINSSLRLESRYKQPLIYIGTKSWRNFIELIKPCIEWDCFKYKISTEEYIKTFNIGENHPLSKLTEEQVREIFKLYNEGWSQKALSEKFNTTCITNILNGRLWNHLGIPIKPKSNHMKSHLTNEQKQKIIELSQTGLSQSKVGDVVGVSQTTIGRILAKLKK